MAMGNWARKSQKGIYLSATGEWMLERMARAWKNSGSAIIDRMLHEMYVANEADIERLLQIHERVEKEMVSLGREKRNF